LGIPKSSGVVNHTNIVALGTGGDGMLYDERDSNSSRRYKLFGGFTFHLSGNLHSIGFDHFFPPPSPKTPQKEKTTCNVQIRCLQIGR